MRTQTPDCPWNKTWTCRESGGINGVQQQGVASQELRVQESLPGGFLPQSVEEGVRVEELSQVQRVREQNLTTGALHPTLDQRSKRKKSFLHKGRQVRTGSLVTLLCTDRKSHKSTLPVSVKRRGDGAALLRRERQK